MASVIGEKKLQISLILESQVEVTTPIFWLELLHTVTNCPGASHASVSPYKIGSQCQFCTPSSVIPKIQRVGIREGPSSGHRTADMHRYHPGGLGSNRF